MIKDSTVHIISFVKEANEANNLLVRPKKFNSLCDLQVSVRGHVTDRLYVHNIKQRSTFSSFH